MNCRGKKSVDKRKRRRKQIDGAVAEKDDGDDSGEGSDLDSDSQEMDVGEEDIKKLALDLENVTGNDSIMPSGSSTQMETEESQEGEVIQGNGTSEQSNNAMETEDGSVFKVTIGPQTSQSAEDGGDTIVIQEKENLFTPPARMNACMAVKNGVLFLYGGMFEVGDKQYTLSDMYSLDLNKIEEWTTIIESDLKDQVMYNHLVGWETIEMIGN